MAGAIELISTSKARGARADDGYRFTCPLRWWIWYHPAHFKALVDDSTFDRFDTYGVLIDAQDASAFAGSGTDTTSELREIVRHQQPIQSVFPLVLEHQFVPLRNDVGYGTSGVGLAERYTAIHASCRLIFKLVLIQSLTQLCPILYPCLGVAILLAASVIFHEAPSLV